MERNEGNMAFSGRADAARRRALEAVRAPKLAIALPGAMQLAGFEDGDMTPDPATVAAWKARSRLK